jgi:hypothetical protein
LASFFRGAEFKSCKDEKKTVPSTAVITIKTEIILNDLFNIYYSIISVERGSVNKMMKRGAILEHIIY